MTGTGRTPVIGLSAYDGDASWGAWTQPAALVPDSYVRSVVAAGGVPVILPVGGDAAAQVALVDALVLTGGPDVEPSRYGAEPHELTQVPHPERDAHEIALAEAAAAQGKPLLAVCRGMQLLHVARGGTLVQHLPEVVGHTGHAPAPGVFAPHEVRLDPGCRLATALGRDVVTVQSHHHQAVEQPGSGLALVGSAPDGTAEAFESTDGPLVLAVQWHPEQDDEPALFKLLVDDVRSRR